MLPFVSDTRPISTSSSSSRGSPCVCWSLPCVPSFVSFKVLMSDPARFRCAGENPPWAVQTLTDCGLSSTRDGPQRGSALCGLWSSGLGLHRSASGVPLASSALHKARTCRDIRIAVHHRDHAGGGQAVFFSGAGGVAPSPSILATGSRGNGQERHG